MIVLGSVLIAGCAVAAFVALRPPAASAVSGPRQGAPIVRITAAARVTGSERGFTGIIGARVQSSLGFRVPGKIVERLVNTGEQVKAGQPKRNAVAAARASVVQTEADEQQYAKLVSNGWASRQRYEQAKAAAEADARVAENEATYSILVADA